jgi:hypothetical protein
MLCVQSGPSLSHNHRTSWYWCSHRRRQKELVYQTVARNAPSASARWGRQLFRLPSHRCTTCLTARCSHHRQHRRGINNSMYTHTHNTTPSCQIAVLGLLQRLLVMVCQMATCLHTLPPYACRLRPVMPSSITCLVYLIIVLRVSITKRNFTSPSTIRSTALLT